MKKAPLVFLAALAASSCLDWGHSPATLAVKPSGDPYELLETVWPPQSGEHVVTNNVLTDSAGLAGVEIEVQLPGWPALTLVASDFIERQDWTEGRSEKDVQVPGEGRASVFATLRRSGEVIADGFTSWTLDDEAEHWEIWFERAPVAAHMLGLPPEYHHALSPPCDAPECHVIRRIEIDPAARNYPAEAFWLTVLRHPGF